MKDLKNLLNKYKAQNITMSLEEERNLLYSYVHFTNKLEGNKLTLVQTSQLLSTDTISGNNIRTRDILEQKGMYKALVRTLAAVRKKEPLSVGLMLEINWLAIGALWKSDDAYLDAKQKGQLPGDFKVSRNLIQLSKGGKPLEKIEPLSNPENVLQNMKSLIDTVKNSGANCIKKAAYIAQELWLHQPFVDGNKRTGRLLINFLTMQEGFPLFVFDDKNKNYNSILVQQYLEKKPGLIEDYIINALTKRLEKSIELKPKKGKGRGYRMIL